MIHRTQACVLIPAYNEEKKIGGIVHELRRLGYHVLVVDDGSTDGTPEAVRRSGAKAVFSEKNEGKGAAIRRGISWIVANGYEAVVIMDGDGQHRPEEVQDFLKALEPGRADVVVGNRMNFPADMPFIRRMTNRVMSRMISAAAKQNIPDTQCGYRALTREVMNSLELKTDRFEIESELLMTAAKKGFRIKSIAIYSVYRDEVSHIRPIKDTLRFLKFYLQSLISR